MIKSILWGIGIAWAVTVVVGIIGGCILLAAQHPIIGAPLLITATGAIAGFGTSLDF